MSTKITRRGFVKGAAAAAPFALSPLAPAQSQTRAGGDRWDVVVIGAGHNSLITACYLQRAGFRTVVLEGRPQIGGGVKTAELTVRGFKHDTCSIQHGSIQNNRALKDLDLAKHGLEYIVADPINHIAFPNGDYITLWQDINRTYEEIAKYSKKDADTYVRMAKEAAGVRRSSDEEGDGPIGWEEPHATPRAPRKLSPGLQRRMRMSKWAVIMHSFEDERVRTFMIGGWPVGLNQDNSGLSAFPSLKPAGPTLPKGGSGMLSLALGRSFEAHGGVILTNKPGVRLIIEGGRCVGVECADGSNYRAAKAVLSTVHIKRLVDMAAKELWGEEFLDGVSTFQTGSSGLNTLYATKEPVRFPVKGGTLAPVNWHTLWSPARALRFDLELILGEVDLNDPEPVLHCLQPSVVDPTRAPAGMHTVRLLGRQPYNLRVGGPRRWDEIKEQVADSHLRALQRLAPNFTDDKILGRFVESPVDIERMNPGMYHGSCHGGTDGPAQSGALRPVPGWAQHRMPIPGLYQTGGTTHPGGGVGGRPGLNAAIVMLKDLGSSIDAVANGKA